MTFRNLPTPLATVGVHSVVIAQDTETGEFRCRLVSNRIPQPTADYYTDDKDDARHTAWAMARHAATAA
jgi:hypothetical protein